MSALSKFNTQNVPQSEPTPGRNEVKNNAGGYVYGVTDKTRLERFLILGTDKGTYYQSEKALTNENIKFVIDLIERDEALVRNTVIDVSRNNRAYRNEPAIFVVAALITYGADKAGARYAVSEVVRTSTHLFTFAQFIENFSGWGRSKRGAVANWYESKTADQLAYQAVKYRQRNGWSHRDLLRLSHAQPDAGVAKYILGKPNDVKENLPSILHGFTAIQETESVEEVVKVLAQYTNLPWETIPTQFLTDPRVWKQLFANGQLGGQALVRNLARLQNMGAFKDMVFAHEVATALTDVEKIRKGRLHPVNYLNAYASDSSVGYYYNRNNTTFEPVIREALDEGFHLSFSTLEPANKRTLVGVDISGSMTSQMSNSNLTSSQAAAALAMAVVRNEPYHKVMGFSHTFVDLNIGAKDRLNTVLRKVQGPFGSTDCALPMQYAAKNNIEVDTFVVITDNETWAGRVKPVDALKRYRDKTGIPARLAVIGTDATNFTIADPNDAGMLDLVGFDASSMNVLADFSAGRF